MHIHSAKAGKYFRLFAVFIIVFFPTYYFAHFGVDTLHDGLVLKAPLDVLKGKVLYKDVYFHFGFLANFISMFFLKIFGPKLLSLRLGTSIIYGLTALVIYQIGTRFYKSWIAFLSIIVWLSLAPYFSNIFHSWPSVYSNLFYAVNILLIIMTIDVKKNKKRIYSDKKIILLGAVSAISFWIKQPYLIIFIMDIGLFITLYLIKAVDRISFVRALKTLMFGFSTVSAVILVYLIKVGSFIDWIKQDFIFAYIWVRIVGSVDQSVSRLSFVIEKPIYLFIPIGLILYFIQTIDGIKTKKTRLNILKFSVSFASLASIFLYYPYGGSRHLFWAIMAVFPIFILFLIDYRNKLIRPKYTIILFVIIYAIYLPQKISKMLVYADKKTYKIENPYVISGLLVNREEYLHFSEVSSKIDVYLGENEEKVLVNKGWNPLYMTFTDKSKNIESMYYDNSGYTSGLYNYQKSLDMFIKNNKPIVLSQYNDEVISGYCLLYSSKEHNLSIYEPKSKGKCNLNCI
jgi:hypothetical protein